MEFTNRLGTMSEKQNYSSAYRSFLSNFVLNEKAMQFISLIPDDTFNFHLS